MNIAVFASLTILCLLSISSMTGLIRLVKADGGTIYIRADGSIDPPTAPIYTAENITYSLTGNITVDADGIVIERDNIVLNGAGYTVMGGGSGNGIDLINRNNVTIKNTNIENFDYGAYLGNASNKTISGNNVGNNGGGIGLDSSNNAVSRNNITANYGHAVRLDYSLNNRVSGNNITANNGDGIYLYHSVNNSISGNNVGNNGGGIGLDYSLNNRVSGNNITANNGDGIIVGSSPDNSVSGNNITANNSYGIHLDSSSNSSITGNKITANNWNGIRLDASSNNSISGNNITANNVYGVGLYTSSNNSISGNNIANNGYGVGLDSFSNFDSISGNNITANNGHGVGLFSSSGNSIFHNNFVNNSVQVYSTSDSANIWDGGYPSGGNYWSDYNGTDLKTGPYQNETGSDGIGDTPYIIDSSNQDNFPLMGMFSDFNATLQYHVQAICNSTISDFQFNSTSISFNASGENGTTGFCTICIPTALINGTFTVSVNGTEVPYTLIPESNSTQSYLYFTYHHSTQEVTIPEFPSFLIPLLFLIATLLTAMVDKKTNKNNPTRSFPAWSQTRCNDNLRFKRQK
jgi:parallel beta-helix repeat protein